jgi:hypothetical protein
MLRKFQRCISRRNDDTDISTVLALKGYDKPFTEARVEMPITEEDGGVVIYSTLKYFHDLRCTETGSVYRIIAPYSAPRPALRGQNISRGSRKDTKVTF